MAKRCGDLAEFRFKVKAPSVGKTAATKVRRKDKNLSAHYTETLTKQEYISRGDQICAAGSFKVGDEARKQFGSVQPTQQQGEQFVVQTIVPIFEDQIAQLRALPAPDGDEKTVTAIYDSLQDGVDKLKANPDLFAAPNAGGVLDRASRLAQEYGFKQCGQR